jgi:hypothetical protein
MRLHLTTRHRSFLICTGDDARDEDAAKDASLVAGAQSADLTASPPPPWDQRVEPYEERRPSGFGPGAARRAL